MSLIESLNGPERRAVAIVGLAIKIHGGTQGEGLFQGVARYGVLEQRLRLAAERSVSVRQCWDVLARMMLWTIGPGRWDADALALISPADDEGDVLKALAERSQSVIMIARSLTRKERAPKETDVDEPPPFDDPLDIFFRPEAKPIAASKPASSDLFGV